MSSASTTPKTLLRMCFLPNAARAADVRKFFKDLSIPDGGVHIVGGPNGEAFVRFQKADESLALARDGELLLGSRVRIVLSSEHEMRSPSRKRSVGLEDERISSVRPVESRKIPGLSSPPPPPPPPPPAAVEAKQTFLEVLERYYPAPDKPESPVREALLPTPEEETPEPFISITAVGDSPRPVSIYKDLRGLFCSLCTSEAPMTLDCVKVLNDRAGRWTGEVLFRVASGVERATAFVRELGDELSDGPVRFGSLQLLSIRQSTDFDFANAVDSYVPPAERLAVSPDRTTRVQLTVHNLPVRFTPADVLLGVVEDVRRLSASAFAVTCVGVANLERCLFFDGHTVEGRAVRVTRMMAAETPVAKKRKVADDETTQLRVLGLPPHADEHAIAEFVYREAQVWLGDRRGAVQMTRNSGQGAEALISFPADPTECMRCYAALKGKSFQGTPVRVSRVVSTPEYIQDQWHQPCPVIIIRPPRYDYRPRMRSRFEPEFRPTTEKPALLPLPPPPPAYVRFRNPQFVRPQHGFTQRPYRFRREQRFVQPFPPPELVEHIGRTLMMNNVPHKATRREILDWMAGFTPLEHTLRIEQDAHGKPTGCATVALETTEAAERARSALSGAMFMGRFVNVVLI